MPLTKEIGPFSLKHMFAVAGFVSTAIAILVLTLFYRDMMVKDIVIQGERQNQLLAQTTLNSVRNELISFLNVVNRSNKFDSNKIKIPPKLEAVIQETLSNNYVTRIRIYSRDGTIVYTTAGGEEDRESNDKGFSVAITGKISSNLELDDLFNFYHKNSEVDNLVETYMPVREGEDGPILGVFEIYTDVRSIVNEVKHTEIIIVLGVVLVLLLLYGLLMMIVSRAANTIGHQQAVIRERTRTLELLSSQLINAQEDEKRAIAHDLHENVAQSLASVKNVIETALTKQAGQNNRGVGDLKQSIKILQESIAEIRSLAMDLRPPALDDFGLVKTLDWLCRQYRAWFPDLIIHTDFDRDKYPLSDAQKTIIYRVAQEALESLGRRDGQLAINLSLSRQGDNIDLTIEEIASDPGSSGILAESTDLSKSPLAAMKQRTMLSGGTFDIEMRPDGNGIVARSSWLLN